VSEARLAVRLTPKARADGIDGWGEDEAGRPFLKVRVRAQHIEGAANAALEALLAKTLGLPKSSVEVAKGATSRLKQVQIRGLDEAQVKRLLTLAR
jgi:uncharacterized protein YggU (UPF0235/DUF167 family)